MKRGNSNLTFRAIFTLYLVLHSIGCMTLQPVARLNDVGKVDLDVLTKRQDCYHLSNWSVDSLGNITGEGRMHHIPALRKWLQLPGPIRNEYQSSLLSEQHASTNAVEKSTFKGVLPIDSIDVVYAKQIDINSTLLTLIPFSVVSVILLSIYPPDLDNPF